MLAIMSIGYKYVVAFLFVSIDNASLLACIRFQINKLMGTMNRYVPPYSANFPYCSNSTKIILCSCLVCIQKISVV